MAQTRRFGVGYVETVTRIADLTITRRVFPPVGARALVTEVSVENRLFETLDPTGSTRDAGTLGREPAGRLQAARVERSEARQPSPARLVVPRGDPGHEALTAYGLMQFRDMQKVYEVDPAMIGRTAGSYSFR